MSKKSGGVGIGAGVVFIMTSTAGCGQKVGEPQVSGQTSEECRDAICPSDQEPQHDVSKDEVLKLDGRWFVGPSKYFSTGTNGAKFFWPSRAAVREEPQVPRHEDAVEIFLRSHPLPNGPTGYELVTLAERNHWIAGRQTLRPGLDQVRMKHEVGPNGQYLDSATYYIATSLAGPDGLPPVASCNHEDARNGGGSGFLWSKGIWAGIRFNQRLCADWPEIYQEIVRVLSQLKEMER